MEITDRGLLYPVVGLASVSVVTALVQVFSGRYPDPILIANLYLLGLGLGLVVARFGRLGPFGGIFGTPWQESRILEILNRESARALRYHRDLTIVALRAVDKSSLELHRGMRATDQHIACRNGWNLIILPETDKASALFLLRQICGDRPVLAALAAPDEDRPRQRIEADLLDQIRSARSSNVANLWELENSAPQAAASSAS